MQRVFSAESQSTNLLAVIMFLLSEVTLYTSFLAVPYKFVLQRAIPGLDGEVRLHPYFASGLLLVAVTTLVLFFASGMYLDKIAYANQYVPHANKALRSFNMYLNVRRAPLRSKGPFNPLSFLFPRPSTSPTTRSRSASPSRPSTANDISRGATLPIAPIPPTTNPRGELIFSSRVDRSFRESYERYRAAFERKREERMRAERRSWSMWLQGKVGWKTVGPPPTGAMTVRTNSGSSRGRGGGSGSVGGTPRGSRRASPNPAVRGGGLTSRSSTESEREKENLKEKRRVSAIQLADC